METDKEMLGYIVYSIIILFMTASISYATWKDMWNKKEMKYALLAALSAMSIGIIVAKLGGDHSIINILTFKVVDNKATLGCISAGYSILLVSIIKSAKHVLFRKYENRGSKIISNTNESIPKIFWLYLSGLVLTGVYFSLFLQAFSGHNLSPITGYSSMFLTGLFFYLWWKYRIQKGWHGTIIGLALGMVVFFIASFVSGYMHNAA